MQVIIIERIININIALKRRIHKCKVTLSFRPDLLLVPILPLCIYHASSSRLFKLLPTMADAVSSLCLLFGSFL